MMPSFMENMATATGKCSSSYIFVSAYYHFFLNSAAMLSLNI